MIKEELLADIDTKCLVVVSTIEEPDAAKNAVGVKQYITHIMEQDGDSVKGRNIGWYTLNEGQRSEAAYYRDAPKQKRNFMDTVLNYCDTITPNTIVVDSYIRAEVVSVNEKDKTALVRAFKKNADQTAKVVELIVYKNGAQPITHVEVV